MGDKDPFEETGLLSAFSTRGRHVGVNLASASEPEAKSSNSLDLLLLLAQGLPSPHSALLSHCPGSPPHPFTRGRETFPQLYQVSLGIQA